MPTPLPEDPADWPEWDATLLSEAAAVHDRFDALVTSLEAQVTRHCNADPNGRCCEYATSLRDSAFASINSAMGNYLRAAAAAATVWNDWEDTPGFPYCPPPSTLEDLLKAQAEALDALIAALNDADVLFESAKACR